MVRFDSKFSGQNEKIFVGANVVRMAVMKPPTPKIPKQILQMQAEIYSELIKMNHSQFHLVFFVLVLKPESCNHLTMSVLCVSTILILFALPQLP